MSTRGTPRASTSTSRTSRPACTTSSRRRTRTASCAWPDRGACAPRRGSASPRRVSTSSARGLTPPAPRAARDYDSGLVARLPYVDPERAPAHVREVLERMPSLNVFLMMANAETAFRPWMRWGGVLLNDLALDPLLRELAILHVARLTPGAEYEWVQHVPIARSVGAAEEQVE